jgi:hypothetical protein
MTEIISKGEGAIDFQKTSVRGGATYNMLLSLDQCDHTFLTFNRLIRSVKKELIKEDMARPEISQVISKLWQVFLFKKIMLRTGGHNHHLRTSTMPKNILTLLQKKYCRSDLQNGVSTEYISVDRGSALHGWIVNEYLNVAKTLFRGVFGYSAHIRFVSNQEGKKQVWEERYMTDHSNFHWDEDLNSFSLIVYLSDVSKDDGAFKVIKDSEMFQQNLYLSAYDQCLCDFNGRDNHIVSNRVGHHLKHVREDDVEVFTGLSGTSVSFYGRHIVHDGGFPSAGGSRIALFLEQRNFLTRPLNFLAKLLSHAL